MSCGDRLDVVATERMATGLYYRVHPTLHPSGSGETLSPLEANPASRARFAISGRSLPGVEPRAMFYVATSPAAALFESLLRSPQMYPGRRVVIPWHHLYGMTLSTVRLLKPEPYVPLMKPERGLVIHSATKDAAWQWYCNTPVHADTHEPAAEIAAQFAATADASGAPMILPAFGYPSVQSSADSVFLHYAPPMDAMSWTVEYSVDLASIEGRRVVLLALAAAGFEPLALPTSSITSDFDPPPGAL